ncbi:Substance-P receptor [Exaiptasia diaphana]|nr:Substance-P receptor [Exaiptasia diaphana]
MAVSDIIVQFCSIPRLVTDLVFDRVRTWLIADTMGVVLCKLMFFIQDICTAVSIECIVLIAIDRFLAVVTPTKMRLTSHGRHRVIVIVMTWVIAMLLHAPYLHFQTVATNRDGSMSCAIDWSPFPQHYHTKYMAILVTILIFIPLGVITILYGVIFTIVKRRKIPGHASSDKRQFRHYEKDYK